MAIELKPGVYWVGVVDWGIRRFHGHELSTHRGTTYNAYLIVDEKIALVDTVWSPFAGQLLENIRQIVDPAKIDYVIANHAEVDHSGALPAVMAAAPNAELIVSKRGAESVPAHFHLPWHPRAVGTGDSISLGKRELIFVEAPMLHWPDSMFTYVKGDAILLSNDAFGQHYAHSMRFNDQVDERALYEECLKYYANILTPFSALVTKKIDEVLSLNLPVDIIAPSHGTIWRSDPLQIVQSYQKWARQEPEASAVVLYDTMWDATRRMADAIVEGLAAEGVVSRSFNMATSDRNDVITEVFRSKAVIVGSPTFNGGVLPTITPVLEDLRGLKFRNKVAAAFGSYGWSGEGVNRIQDHMHDAKFEIAAEGLKVKWQPSADDLKSCRELGGKIAEAVKA